MRHVDLGSARTGVWILALGRDQLLSKYKEPYVTTTRLYLLLSFPPLLQFVACGGEKASPGSEKAADEGTAAADCRDGADNDADGLFDCDDDGCAASPDCERGAENAAPSAAAIAIEPAAPGDADDLTCTIVTEATDPNGDAVSYSFAWARDGADAGVSGATVGAALTGGGDTWTCIVTPTDGTLQGASASASVTIAQDNRAPSAPTVSISPEAPTDNDVLTCVVDTESVDLDGDTVTYAYAWSVDGADAGESSATVNAARTEVGQRWTCSVTASDGDLVSGAAVATAEVLPSCDADDHDCDGIATSSELLAACWATTSLGDSDYYLCGPDVWAAAESVCNEAGVHLAALTSATESTIVASWVQTESAGPFVWVGFNDIASEGTFEWTSGESFSYTNWHPGEPDNTNEPGDCGNLAIPVGDWWDGSCTVSLPYVCEAPHVE